MACKRRARTVAIPAAVLPVYPPGSVTVTFKYEDDIRGQPAGPVVVIHEPTFAAWRAENGVEMTPRGHFLLPVGATPDGMHRLGWFTRHGATKIAAHYAVTLEES